MHKKLLAVVFAQLSVLAATPPATPQRAAFTFPNFAQTSSLQLNGSAARASTADGAVIQLTTASPNQAASAFMSDPISLDVHGSFSTFFTFRRAKPAGASVANGLAFVIQAGNATSLGSASGWGYTGISSNSLAIAFVPGTTGPGTTADHLALKINGFDKELVSAPLSTSPLSNGQLGYAWVDFDGTRSLLEARISDQPVRPPTATLAAVVGLPSILGSGASSPATGNLLTNGDFEDQPHWGQGVSFDGGETALTGSDMPGWTIEPGHAVTVHVAPGPYLVISGQYSINADGEGYNSHNANFYQDFSTTSNASYTLSFDWQSWGLAYTPTTNSLRVSLTDPSTGAALFTGLYHYDGDGQPHPVHSVTAPFTGTGHQVRLRIEENPESGYNDNTYMVDNFRVTGTQPPVAVHVGFTAGNGASGTEQDVLSWKFMALPLTRFTGHYSLNNVSPNFRLTNGVLLKFFTYKINGITFTNVYSFPEQLTQNADGSVDFQTDAAPTATTPDVDPGNEEEGEWMSSLLDYNDLSGGNSVSGVVVPATSPVPDGQPFDQQFPTISETDMESLLQDLSATPPPLQSPSALNQVITLQADQLNQILQAEQQKQEVMQDMAAGGGFSGAPASPAVNQLSTLQQAFDQINQSVEAQGQVMMNVMNDMSSYSLSKHIGTLQARQQLLSAPPGSLHLLSTKWADGKLFFNFVTVSNRSYTVSTSTNLATANWTAYTNIVGDGYPASVSIPAQLRQSYFRASSP